MTSGRYSNEVYLVQQRSFGKVLDFRSHGSPSPALGRVPSLSHLLVCSHEIPVTAFVSA